jgi:hypothetical protein
MNTRFLKFVLPVAMLTILAAFLLTSPVHAQDATPTDPAPVLVTTNVPVSQATAPDLIPTDQAPTVAPTDVPVDALPTPDATPTEAVPLDTPIDIAQPPVVDPVGLASAISGLSDAGLTLVDNNNQPLPLASQQAAVALVLPDPWFMSGGVFHGYVNIADAVAAVAGGLIPTDGFIHVDPGTLPNQKVSIDGSNANIALLKGIIGHVDPDTLSPDAILNDTDGVGGSWFTIRNMLNGFSLIGLNINGSSTYAPGYGVVEFLNNTGSILLQDLVVKDTWSGGEGIRIDNQNGSVTLKNVDSSVNAGGGTYIDNSTGVAGVTISNSSFNDNLGDASIYPTSGIHIITRGPVSITAVTSSRNAGTYPGLMIEQASSVTIKDSVFSNNNPAVSVGVNVKNLNGAITLQNVYADGNRFGMLLSTRGNITLTGVSASGNTDLGATLDTCWGTPCTAGGTGKVTINGGHFDGNVNTSGAQYHGLSVSSRGAISLADVSANNNGSFFGLSYGALLDTGQSQLVSPITVSNSSFNYDYNEINTLLIISKGAITLKSVQNSNNGYGGGALLDNTYGTTAGVTLLGSSSAWNYFDGNFGPGITIHTNGPISLSYIEASNNNGEGVDLLNTGGTGNVTLLQGVMEYDSLGLQIYSHGAISLTSITSTHNTYNGIFLDNHQASTPKPITFTHGYISTNGFSGVNAYSKGAFFYTDVIANNSLYGIYIDNTSGTAGVTLKDSGANNNTFTGVLVYTNGPINLTNVSSNTNGVHGFFLRNWTALTPQSITVNGMTANSNQADGLRVLTTGAINLSNIYAQYNSNFGVMLGDTAAGIIPKSVTINYATMDHNGWGTGGYDNLRLLSGSYVTLSYVTADSCSWFSCYGAMLGDINVGPTSIPGIVTISHSTFTNNYQDGLLVYSNGNIVLSDVVATDNGIHGANLTHVASVPLFPTVSISNSVFNHNGSWGLLLYSRGGITITNIKANSNINGDGAHILNDSGNVSILTTGSGFNEFKDNGGGGDGLDLDTPGLVIMKNVAATGNTGGFGAIIYNSFGTGYVGDVTVTGGTFSSNSQGLRVLRSNGAILVNGITAIGNTLYGARFDNTDDHTGTKSININKSIFDKNGTGLEVRSWGQITLNNVSASGSTTGTGAYLDNTSNTLLAPKGISVLGTLGSNLFNSNNFSGLIIASKGSVLVTKATVNDNGYYGINIDNYFGGLGKGTVILSYITANFGRARAITISSNNNVTLTFVTVMFTAPGWRTINIETNNHNLTVSNSLITANGNTGLFAFMGGSVGIFQLINTYYFGNGSPNILVTH